MQSISVEYIYSVEYALRKLGLSASVIGATCMSPLESGWLLGRWSLGQNGGRLVGGICWLTDDAHAAPLADEFFAAVQLSVPAASSMRIPPWELFDVGAPKKTAGGKAVSKRGAHVNAHLKGRSTQRVITQAENVEVSTAAGSSGADAAANLVHDTDVHDPPCRVAAVSVPGPEVVPGPGNVKGRDGSDAHVHSLDKASVQKEVSVAAGLSKDCARGQSEPTPMPARCSSSFDDFEKMIGRCWVKETCRHLANRVLMTHPSLPRGRHVVCLVLMILKMIGRCKVKEASLHLTHRVLMTHLLMSQTCRSFQRARASLSRPRCMSRGHVSTVSVWLCA